MLSNLQSAYERTKDKSSSGKKYSGKNATSIQALQELSTNLFGGASTRDEEEYVSVRERPVKKEEFVSIKIEKMTCRLWVSERTSRGSLSMPRFRSRWCTRSSQG
jgi:hypothetical protein